METIKINSIEKKVSQKTDKPFWVVRYNENGDATIGAWDAQFADYIEKDVGIGGSVKVEIVKKGEYTNITGVDMTSGVKGDKPVESTQTAYTPKPTNDREKSIVAQCLTKCVMMHDIETENIREFILDTYVFFLVNL